jgi:hypothetical protein
MAAVAAAAPRDVVALIDQSFPRFDNCDDAMALVRSFDKKPNRLRPNEAVRVIRIAGQRFGNEGIKGAFNLLKDRFIDRSWFWGTHILYPQSQLTLLRSLTALNVDVKTSLYVLGKLGYYNCGEEAALSVNYREDTIDDQGSPVDKRTEVTIPMLLEPIRCFGDHYGQDAAKKVVVLARDHYQMHFSHEFRLSIGDYFKNAFGEASGIAIQKELYYPFLNQLADFLTPSNGNEDTGPFLL